MYVVFQSGGRQYRADLGSVVKVERIPGNVGDTVSLDRILLCAQENDVQVGQPLLEGITAQGRIVEQGREKKILILKHKRRKDYRKRQGHRQAYTALYIEAIAGKHEESGPTGEVPWNGVGLDKS
ncbi:MAG: 50S ribosomal protein L21 [Syntrophobacteraceae bacterium]|nr:50S ribosomal protein L21 [Syntrophobacteraceae bacterium]